MLISFFPWLGKMLKVKLTLEGLPRQLNGKGVDAFNADPATCERFLRGTDRITFLLIGFPIVSKTRRADTRLRTQEPFDRETVSNTPY